MLPWEGNGNGTGMRAGIVMRQIQAYMHVVACLGIPLVRTGEGICMHGKAAMITWQAAEPVASPATRIHGKANNCFFKAGPELAW